MKKAILSLTALISISAQAQNSGYFTETCVSTSGRTVVTMASNETSAELNIIVDGASSKYVKDVNGVDISNIGEALLVTQNNKEVLILTAGKNAKAIISQDPRTTSSVSQKNAKTGKFQVAVKCGGNKVY
jgi:hypothetical protein